MDINSKNNSKKDRVGVFQKVKSVVLHDLGAWCLLIPCFISLLIFAYQPMLNGIYLSFSKTV